MEFVIITGMSGSGKSRAIAAMEDIGYYCVDNLPPRMVKSFTDLCLQAADKVDKVAIVIDARSREIFGDIFEGKVIRTEFPNKGIIDIEGQKVIVKNALEGQVVRFSINKKKRDKIEGRLLEVIEPSPIEQPAACKHFGICGGCRYQNLSYEQQLDLKKRQVEELIEKSGLSFAIENIYGSPITEGYRNKMEFTFGDEEKDGPLALGMHKKNSFYDIVTLEDCRIVDPDFNVLLQAILKYFKEKTLPVHSSLCFTNHCSIRCRLYMVQYATYSLYAEPDNPGSERNLFC